MAKNPLNTRIANVAKQYRNSGAAVLSLIVDLVTHAKENNHNMDLVNKFFGYMDGDAERRAFITIVKDLCNATVKQDKFKMPAEREYHERDYAALYPKAKSFRSVADAINGADKKDKSGFVAKDAAASLVKKLKKEKADPLAFLKELMDQLDTEKVFEEVGLDERGQTIVREVRKACAKSYGFSDETTPEVPANEAQKP